MLFNSIAFALFFLLVTSSYFAIPQRFRWMLLLASSCCFYMYFIPKYMLVLGFTIVVDYVAAILIESRQGRIRRFLLILSILANVGVLAFFKYFNFLNDNLAFLARSVGWNYSISNLEIILPIGLSFHTFQAMSYTIEVYRGSQKAERHFGIYALFVMFFPQLVAGPIERPQNLLPQFHQVHQPDYERIVSGLKLMAWGLFKKAVVADSLANFSNFVFAHPSTLAGPIVATGVVYFTFQIYCDFSGYSDIARGSARVLGFELMRNFDRPFHSRSIAEFWRRWHISLSTWFRDYIYFLMGGRRRVSHARRYLNIFLLFVLSGLWHGASWTFVIWGGLHGAYLIVADATKGLRERLSGPLEAQLSPRFRTCIQVTVTFLLVAFASIFFRAHSLENAFDVLGGLCSGWTALFQPSVLAAQLNAMPAGSENVAIFGICMVILLELIQSRLPILATFRKQPFLFRWSLYYAVAAAIIFLGSTSGDQFIYFQF